MGARVCSIILGFMTMLEWFLSMLRFLSPPPRDLFLLPDCSHDGTNWLLGLREKF